MDYIEELITLVNLALDDLYKNDEYLLKVDAHERNIVFHFGRYFINKLERNNNFNKFNVDYEYNRDTFNENMYKEIIYDKKEHRIYPDIILHKRGSNDDNILAIEFKKYSNKKDRTDDYKLKALTQNDLTYKYKLGLFIRLGKTRKKVDIIRYIDGKKQS